MKYRKAITLLTLARSIEGTRTGQDQAATAHLTTELDNYAAEARALRQRLAFCLHAMRKHCSQVIKYRCGTDCARHFAGVKVVEGDVSTRDVDLYQRILAICDLQSVIFLKREENTLQRCVSLWVANTRMAMEAHEAVLGAEFLERELNAQANKAIELEALLEESQKALSKFQAQKQKTLDAMLNRAPSSLGGVDAEGGMKRRSNSSSTRRKSPRLGPDAGSWEVPAVATGASPPAALPTDDPLFDEL